MYYKIVQDLSESSSGATIGPGCLGPPWKKKNREKYTSDGPNDGAVKGSHKN